MADTNELALVSPQDLSLVENNSLNASQLALILKKTPKQYVKQRPAKGGGTWDYVSGGYVKKCLNLMFGWDWSFEVIEDKIIFGEVIVKGRLTCRSNGKEIVKMQYGNKDIIFKTEKVLNEDGTPKMIDKYNNGRLTQETRPTEMPLSIGNDFKSAATDALKKCAAEIGIAADIYNKDDFREIKVDTTDYEEIDLQHEELVSLFEELKDNITAEDFDNVKTVITKKQVKAYKRIQDFLNNLKQSLNESGNS